MFFRSPETKVEQKQIDGTSVMSFTRDTKEFSIEMSLVPEFGWNIRRIVIDYPKGDGNGITQRQFDASEFEKREGIFLPRKLTMSRVHPEKEFPNLSWHLTDFQVNQKGDLGFGKALSKVPDHASVTVQDALHLSPTRTVEDGKIVAQADEAMLAAAHSGHKFMPGYDEPRFWMLWLGILMILIALGKMLYDAIWKSRGRGK